MQTWKVTGNTRDHFDVVIIGSGFGGAVSALRLAEKGYRVAVLEAGRRFADEDFPETSWDLRRFLWAPRLGLLGLQRIHLLDDVLVLAGSGVGGGSLNYANTLYQPTSDAFYRDEQWGHITDWRGELEPYYQLARSMLGVVINPTMTPADEVMQAVAVDLGVGHTFRMAPVGVHFGADDQVTPGVTVDDPFFDGAGPPRTGCIECGSCMTGCRHNAKNTLVKNYLHLAERAGAVIVPETTVDRLASTGTGFVLETHRSGLRRRPRRTYRADQVVVAAGTWGTQQLLHRMKADGSLPHLSPRLGVRTRTNSESLGGAQTRRRNSTRVDFTRGVAITSSIHPDEHTHVQPVRYGKGSNAMALLGTVLIGGDAPRWKSWLESVLAHPGQLVSMYAGIGKWAERTVIGLVMQSVDNSITVGLRRSRLGRTRLGSTSGAGRSNPTFIPLANETYKRMAHQMDGYPASAATEIFDIPVTAHFIGGCTIGESAETGVVDPYHRVFGHPGLHIVDGSTISANLGVNPSLTITAQAERAMALWPNKGGDDPRPPFSASYRPLTPIDPSAAVTRLVPSAFVNRGPD